MTTLAISKRLTCCRTLSTEPNPVEEEKAGAGSSSEEERGGVEENEDGEVGSRVPREHEEVPLLPPPPKSMKTAAATPCSSTSWKEVQQNIRLTTSSTGTWHTSTTPRDTLSSKWRSPATRTIQLRKEQLCKSSLVLLLKLEFEKNEKNMVSPKKKKHILDAKTSSNI